ncbi:hypothetical protein FisN_28Hh005 [Fistulifera solaris]|uniref:Uncharacterized protein n=1 Tax=Fistulifera solaris TaxID=1519565 RepID=A0A1Z5KH42_FISSO|nr:hypothetical protein FisN_28Hh005 [Fistulifera solaris]|eukprot:GAX25537.1 hypothetical protein FisN_28Hh005 [Fistulifera solaris]
MTNKQLQNALWTARERALWVLWATTLAAWGWQWFSSRRQLLLSSSSKDIALELAQQYREKLPATVILVRHGESEGNADSTLFRTIPDNLLGLTEKGFEQAACVGQRIRNVFRQLRPSRVHLVVSPFERTLQTAATLRASFEHLIEQKKVGRFWYRFPTGESGADVYDRVKSWWTESVATVNVRVGYEPIDALVVVTHGLTMRFVLMQLFSWSPTTFHSVWNAGNCDMYVLRKDLSKAGPYPYVLCEELGDKPKSSIDVSVTCNNDERDMKIYRLDDYLSIPSPRTTRLNLIKQMLAKQYPALDVNTITCIKFMPFVEGGVVVGRSSSGVASRHGLDSFLDLDDRLQETAHESSKEAEDEFRFAKREFSSRFPNFTACNN